MSRIAGFWFFALLITACSQQAMAQAGIPALAEVAAQPGVTKDACWLPVVKKAMHDRYEESVGRFNAALKGRYAAADKVILSPHTVEAEGFSLISIDEVSGHVMCNATVVVTFRTKDFGTLVLPQQSVDFEIKQAEEGAVVNVPPSSMAGYVAALTDTVKSTMP